jgi:hypothetical protein
MVLEEAIGAHRRANLANPINWLIFRLVISGLLDVLKVALLVHLLRARRLHRLWSGDVKRGNYSLGTAAIHVVARILPAPVGGEMVYTRHRGRGEGRFVGEGKTFDTAT